MVRHHVMSMRMIVGKPGGSSGEMSMMLLHHVRVRSIYRNGRRSRRRMRRVMRMMVVRMVVRRGRRRGAMVMMHKHVWMVRRRVGVIARDEACIRMGGKRVMPWDSRNHRRRSTWIALTAATAASSCTASVVLFSFTVHLADFLSGIRWRCRLVAIGLFSPLQMRYG